MTVIRTKTPAGEPIVIMPEAEFERLRELAEDAEDAAIIARSQADLVAGREELLTLQDVEALRRARTPLAFWRTKRGMGTDALAAAAGVSRDVLDEVERGEQLGNVHLYRRLADALRVDVDDLIPAEG
jgi:DNA-binding XRE family transcriptional regulator